MGREDPVEFYINFMVFYMFWIYKNLIFSWEDN